MVRSVAVTGADTAAAKLAVAAVGATHVVLAARWDALAPRGPSEPLDAGQLNALRSGYAEAAAAGLAVVLDHQLQYPPGWVRSAVEPFTDQHGHAPARPAGPAGAGQDVRNWMWTGLGRGYVRGFVDRLAGALGAPRVRATAGLILGGGSSGYLQYPPQPGRPPFRYWGYGPSMQAGDGLAADPLLAPCPLPGYVPFTGTDAQDVSWIDWYLDGIESWVAFGVRTLRGAGYGGDILVAHPPRTVRADSTRSLAAYRSAMAEGADAVRVVGRYAPDPGVFPLAASLSDPDPASRPRADSQQSTWKKIAAEATLRGHGARMWGAGGGTTAGDLAAAFGEALTPDPPSGRPLEVGRALTAGKPASAPYLGYTGLVWGPYAGLAGGAAGQASLTDLRAAIGTRPRLRTWASGVQLDNGDPAAARAFSAAYFPIGLESWYADSSGPTEAAGWAALSGSFATAADRAFPAPCLNLVSVPLLPAVGPGGQNPVLLRAAATGAHTADWVAVARALQSAGFDTPRTILRLGWEPNGSWFPWGTTGDPSLIAAYKAAWVHAVTAMRSVLRERVRFDLCINNATGGPTAAEDHFPGAAYVDIIGLDHFDWFPGATDAATWAVQTKAPSFAETAALARKYGKKWSLDEWACADVASHGAGDNPSFVQRIFDELRSLGPLVSHDCYFDYAGIGTHDLARNPRAAALYKRLWTS